MGKHSPDEKLRLLNSIRNTMAGAGSIVPAEDDFYVRILDEVMTDLKWVYRNADKIRAALEGGK